MSISISTEPPSVHFLDATDLFTNKLFIPLSNILFFCFCIHCLCSMCQYSKYCICRLCFVYIINCNFTFFLPKLRLNVSKTNIKGRNEEEYVLQAVSTVCSGRLTATQGTLINSKQCNQIPLGCISLYIVYSFTVYFMRASTPLRQSTRFYRLIVRFVEPISLSSEIFEYNQTKWLFFRPVSCRFVLRIDVFSNSKLNTTKI